VNFSLLLGNKAVEGEDWGINSGTGKEQS